MKAAERNPSTTLMYATLAVLAVVALLAAITTEVDSYKTLAVITQMCAALSVLLLISVTREAVAHSPDAISMDQLVRSSAAVRITGQEYRFWACS